MRFNQPVFVTAHFSENIWVKCPACSDIGVVETDLGKYNIPYPTGYKSKFNCKNCSATQIDNRHWYGHCVGYVNQSCGFCGTKVSYIGEPTKELHKSLNIKCSACNKEKEYDVVWHRYSEDKPTDQFFGFDLWLQVNIKTNVLWFYNLTHLNYIKEYVAAKIREDDNRHKYSIITNLPQWVKSAKNRDLIVKKLTKLEESFRMKLKNDDLNNS